MSAQEELQKLQDILKLIDENVPLSIIETWSARQRERVEDWALALHLRASDNDVRVPAVPNVIRKFRVEKHVNDTQPFQRFEPSLQKILRGLPPIERDALIVLINFHPKELSAQSVQHQLDGDFTLAFTRSILQNLARRELVKKNCAKSWAGRFQVTADVMKMVRE